MLDGQFNNEHNAKSGISLVVTPGGSEENRKDNKWVAVEKSKQQERKKIQITDNMTTMDRVILCAAEVGGTGILVFLGCASCINFGIAPTLLQICITFGLAVMVAVQCFGHISGSHINPVVTVAAATLGNIPLIQVPVYFVGQMLGALAGFGLLKLATPHDIFAPNNASGPGLCSPHLNPNVSPVQGLLVEFILCFILALVCCGVWDSRNSTKHDSVAIRFGFTISVLALAGAPYTGANMNPARSFAPALINGDWANHWLYWVGPLAAAFMAALLYRIVFTKEGMEEAQENTAEVIPLNDKA